nr:hypothetical protein [Tanacetum cinerariifolium]
HQNTQQYGAILPIELTTEDIRNTTAYKKYYVCATGEAAPKPKTNESDDDDDDQEEAKKVNDDDDNEEEVPKIDEQETTESDEGNDEATESDREKEEADELYRDVDINQGRGLQVSRETEDSHVILTLTQSDAQQESSSTSSFMTNLLNPIIDPGMESIFTTGSTTITPIPSPQSTMTPSIISTFITASQLPTPQTQIPSLDLQSLLSFASKIIKEKVKTQVKAQVTRIFPRIEESVNAQLEAEVLTRSSHFSRTSYAVAADLSEMELKKILIDKMEGNKSIQRSDEQWNLYKALVEAYDADKTILDTYGESAILKRRRADDDQEGPSAGSDRGSKRRREGGEHASANTPSEPATGSAGRSTIETQSRQIFASESAFTEEPVQTTCQMKEPSHPVFETDTPIDFSNFIMNRLGVDTLTPDLLAGPTYKLMRGSCNSLTELEYHLEKVYKATTDQLDWVNPEGQQYPHNLLQPLPLIPDNRGRREPINYDKHALWGFSHWGRKHQQFYGFAVNRESALDVYSKRRIIAVTELRIVEWHNYKHLNWISIRRDNDKIYKFKEGDLKRLRLQDIKDMLLLLVQGKLSNLTVEERFVFNVSLRMFTRSIVIQRRVEDLQLGVESYQNRLNLTKPDTYRSDLKRRKAYTAYSNPRGFIYQNKEKKNRLMRIDELHKFSDGTLNDVRNALDDRLKGIRM